MFLRSYRNSSPQRENEEDEMKRRTGGGPAAMLVPALIHRVLMGLFAFLGGLLMAVAVSFVRSFGAT